MTTEQASGPPDGPHLDDEAVSAALDDEARPSEAAHLAGCDRCQALLRRFAAAAAAVAAPPPAVPAATRDAAIAAAAAHLDPRGPVARSDLRSRRRARPPLTSAPWLGVAAVVLLLVLALPLLAGIGGGDDADDTSAGVAADAPTGGSDDATAALGAPTVVDVGHLGAIEAGTDLREVADRALGPGRGPTTTAAAGGPDDAVEEGGGEAAASAAPERAADVAAEPCVEVARADLGDPGPLVLAGTATVEGADVLVLGFDSRSAARPTVLLVVVATEDCRLVTFQAYLRR